MTTSTYLGLCSDDLERRSRLLAASGDGQPEPERRRLSAAIEELNSAIASLRTGDELLRQQNADLDTAIARAEREHRRYYTLFEFAPIGLLVSDSRGVIIEANRAAGLLCGCARSELLGQPITDCLDGASAAQVSDLIARVFTNAGASSCYGGARRRDGAPCRIIITLEADISGETGNPRIRWAIQLKGSPDAALPVPTPADQAPARPAP